MLHHLLPRRFCMQHASAVGLPCLTWGPRLPWAPKLTFAMLALGPAQAPTGFSKTTAGGWSKLVRGRDVYFQCVRFSVSSHKIVQIRVLERIRKGPKKKSYLRKM